MTPLKAIRAKCLDCSESAKDVRECTHKDCELYPFRMGRGRGQYLKAIRKHCLWCCNDQPKEVRLDPWEENVAECPLWGYRFGRKENATDSVLEMASPEGFLVKNRAVRGGFSDKNPEKVSVVG